MNLVLIFRFDRSSVRFSSRWDSVRCPRTSEWTAVVMSTWSQLGLYPRFGPAFEAYNCEIQLILWATDFCCLSENGAHHCYGIRRTRISPLLLRYVESSFWNFDALFQPQQHPARDAHDTFFISGTVGRGNRSVDWRLIFLKIERDACHSYNSIYSCKVLHSLTGKTPSEYLEMMRILRVCEREGLTRIEWEIRSRRKKSTESWTGRVIARTKPEWGGSTNIDWNTVV